MHISNIPLDKRLRVLEEEELLAVHGAINSMAHDSCSAAHFWNIREHKLYRAIGAKSMRAYCLKRNFNLKTMESALQRGSKIAAVMLDGKTGDDRWLTDSAIKAFYQTAKRVAFVSAESRMHLLSDGGDNKDDHFVNLETAGLNEEIDPMLAQVASQHYSANTTKALTTKRKKVKTSPKQAQDDAISRAVQTLRSAAESLLIIWNHLDGVPPGHPLRKQIDYYINLCMDYTVMMPRNRKKMPNPIPFVSFQEALESVTSGQFNEELRPDVYHAYTGELR